MQLQFFQLFATSDRTLCTEAAALLLEGRIKMWVAVHDGCDVGHCSVDFTTGEVLGLSVLPAYRRRGIGRKLLMLAVDKLRESGTGDIWLAAPADPQIAAHAFYRALGWQHTGERLGKEPFATEILKLPTGNSPSTP